MFNLVFTKLQDAFYRFFKFKIIFRYSRSKLKTTTGFLWEAQTKTAKIDYFTKNLSSPMFFETNTSKFQEMFLDIFKNYFVRN